MWVERFSAVPDSDQDTHAHSATLFADDEGALLESAYRGRHVLHLDSDDIAAAFRGDTRLNLPHGPKSAPGRIIILVHGFEFEPRVGWMENAFDQPNPHHAIFHNRPEVAGRREKRSHNTPWLTRLGRQDGDLVIPFAFASDPGRLAVDLADDRFMTGLRRHYLRVMRYRQFGTGYVNLFGFAYAQAGLFASGLATLIALVAAKWQGDRGPAIHIVGHSLGARVIISALEQLARRPAGHTALDRVGRVILLAAALARHQILNLAEAHSSAALNGRGPEIFNFTSASDLVLRLLGARLSNAMASDLTDPARPPRLLPSIIRTWRRPEVAGIDGGQALASSLRWIDIPLDHPETRAWGLGQGMSLSGDYRDCMMDHWVHFTHTPNWQLYRNILSGDPAWSTDAIRTGKDANGRVLKPPLTARSGTKYRIVSV